MTKTVLINMLEQHGFSRPDADALVSGLTAEMVKAAERETLSAIVGLYGGVIATGLVVIGLVATLMIVPVRPPVDAITAGMQSKFTEFSEGIATQIANAEVDTHARFDQSEARLGRIETRMGALEGRLATIENQLNGIDARLDSLDNKIDVLRDMVSA